MIIKVLKDKPSLASAAAAQAATLIQKAISEKGAARIIAATGAAQIEFLEALTAIPGIDWKQVEMFHLDEYIGLPISHPASFRSFLLTRLINKTGMTRYHLLDGETDPGSAVRQVGKALASAPVDVAFVGIGENGHLAFNDPPADFKIEDPYLIVELDEACRRQQLGEGWFASLSDVPKEAISMSVQQVLRAQEIIAIVPDKRKAQAVAACFEGEISPMAPSSILRNHPRTTIYLDEDSASLLSSATRAALES